MTCDEVIKAIDEREPGAQVPAECFAHARECPDCAFALRLELALQEAPAWSPKPSLSAAARGRVLKKAGAATGFGTLVQGIFEESAVTAGALLLLVVAGAFLLPSVLRNTLKPEALDAARRTLAPVLAPLQDFLSQFSPMMHRAGGLVLLALAGFAILFAAVFTARMMRLEARRAY
jgi:hypothetical protein